MRSAAGVDELGPGDLIGRSTSARLVIDDPAVSEAHAMVSLRHGELVLLALRRLFSVNGKPLKRVTLAKGMRIELASGVDIKIDEVVIPERIAAVEAAGLSIRPLGHVASLHAGPPPRVSARYEASAPAHVWHVRDAWRLRQRGGGVVPLNFGDAFLVDGLEFKLTSVAVDRAADISTSLERGVDEPLHIVSSFDALEIRKKGAPSVSIGGVGARIVSELLARGGSAEWHLLASTIWRDDPTAFELRQRFDAALARLRAKLRKGGVRTDLVCADGTGGYHFSIRDADELVTRS